MKRAIWISMALLLLALGGHSFAEICSLDAVPAATLLLPAFQVSIGDENGNGVMDCADGSGVDTLFSINNASAAPTIAHVVMWTDWSLPTIDFDIFLTGYDVQTISLCAAFNTGDLPRTAHATNDPSDTVSPGPSVWDSAPDNPGNPLFPGCDVFLPWTNPVLAGTPLLDAIRTAHSGQNTNGFFSAGCGGSYTYPIATGYITVDQSTDCAFGYPSEGTAYWGRVAGYDNILWGDYVVVKRTEGFAQGDNLVHIEAANDGFFVLGDYTFYGRHFLNEGGSVVDRREPLGETWATRYLNGGPFSGGTTLEVWRDSTYDYSATEINAGYDCAANPPWYALNETQVVCWDEQEDPLEICNPGGGDPGPPISPGDPTDPVDPVCFPLEVNFSKLGDSPLTLPADFGWCFLNLNHTLDPGIQGANFGGLAQSYVTQKHDTPETATQAGYSVGYPGISITDICDGANATVVVP